MATDLTKLRQEYTMTCAAIGLNRLQANMLDEECKQIVKKAADLSNQLKILESTEDKPNGETKEAN